MYVVFQQRNKQYCVLVICMKVAEFKRYVCFLDLKIHINIIINWLNVSLLYIN